MWEKTRIPTRYPDLYNERQLLNKHRQQTTPANLRNQVEYTRKIYALFDIAHEDRQFLHQQRVDRSGSFGSFNKSLAVCERTAATRAAGREPPRDTPSRSKPPTETDVHGLIVTGAQVHHIY